MALQVSSAQSCDRSGCSGTIEDGYCTVCGLTPIGVAPAAVAVSTSGRTRDASSALGTRSTRSTPSSSRPASSRLLSSGLIDRPPLPPQDPLATLVPGEVPASKRYCSNCSAKLSRVAGFCPKCGQQYSFTPSLKPGDLVTGKYEIKGTVAFGGLGWIYLALDTVLSRWVVLKGLLNARDPALVAVAVKEREFLAAVKHRSIVGIYDFITQGREGFIVMEYVNGKTLMTLRKEHDGPLPVAEAISYILDLLPAFAYLSDMGLDYCDFKPENAMLEGEEVRLIDMGAVRRVDDPEGDVYGSRGYAAPEASDDPSPLSDLYTVARTLAVLIANFDFQGRYEHALPPASEVAVFQEQESLYRFLIKATRPAPEDRFQSAPEMVEQLLGVIREVVAGSPTADVSRVKSSLFSEEDDAYTGSGALADNALTFRDLPALKLDPLDPAQPTVLAAAVLPDADRRRALYEQALVGAPDSLELQLRLAGELIELGAFAEAWARINPIHAAHPRDWRPEWYRARLLLAQGEAKEAIAAFQAVFDELPGELAPKLGLAIAYELAGELERAIHYYDIVSNANPALTAAAFGLARCRERLGDRAAAAAAYQRVPGTSSRQPKAQMGMALVLLACQPDLPSEEYLSRAAQAIESLRGAVDGLEVHDVSARLLKTAAESIEMHVVQSNYGNRILGVPLDAKRLRRGAEGELRACARYAKDGSARIWYVDEANRVRPRTLV